MTGHNISITGILDYMDNAVNMPNNNENVAQPQPEQQPAVGLEQVKSTSEEKPATAPVETNQAITQAVPIATNPPVSQQLQQQTPVVANQVHTSAVTSRALQDLSQLEAENEDLIEKPWVDKVEEIIDETRDDPRTEDDAHHQVSKAYLKKRFNLDVS